jgi:hypothetical protein
VGFPEYDVCKGPLALEQFDLIIAEQVFEHVLRPDWTEQGIRQLLETAGFNVQSSGSWGNLKCLKADLRPGLSWTVYDPLRHSLENDPQFAIVVWVFATKPK